MAARHDQARAIPVFRDAPRDHPAGCVDGRWPPAVGAHCRGLLHERGIVSSHETVRFWRHHFGPMLAAELSKRRVDGMCSSHWKWHLDEVVVKIDGDRHCLWRAVDDEGEVSRRSPPLTPPFQATSTRSAVSPIGRSSSCAELPLSPSGADFCAVMGQRSCPCRDLFAFVRQHRQTFRP